MPLLERDRELRLLRDAVAGAARGTGSAVLLAGSAGTGKTSLVEAAAAEVTPPVRVLTAACDDLAVPAPLGAVRDLSQALRGTAAHDVLASSSDVVRIGLALVAELSAPQAPAMLVVDDAHWADSATVDVLTFLIRRAAPLRAAVVVAYRHDDDADRPWRRALSVLTAPHVDRVRLRPLSREGVAGLTAGSGLDAEQVHGTTGGNPLFVREVLRAGRVAPTATIVDLVVGRLARLPGDVRRLAEVLAVVPGRVERPLAAALDEAGVLDVLERRHVLDGDTATVWFPHELVRRAVEETVPSGDRRHSHERVLRALLAGAVPDVPPARLVHHAVAAGDAAVVARFAPLAARQGVASGAHREASGYFRAALRHPQLLDRREEIELRTQYARELWQFHRLAEARAQAQSAIALCRPGTDDALLAHALVTSAISAPPEAAIDAVLDTAERAVAVLEPSGPTEDLGWALCWLAAVYVLSPRHHLAVATAERAMEIGRRVAVPGVVGHALIVRGQARQDASGTEDLLAGVELVRAAGLRHHTLWGLGELGHRLAWHGDLTGAVEALRRSRDLAEDLQQESWALNAIAEELATRLQLGRDWASVEEDLRAALARPVEQPELLFDLHGILARLLARRGDPTARHHADEGWRLAGLHGDRLAAAVACVARLEEAWLTGHVEDVVDDVRLAASAAETENDAGLLAELAVYCVRAGLAPPAAVDDDRCPPPWRHSLRGDHAASALAWAERGGLYEYAWELAAQDDAERSLEALRVLDGLGAAGAALVLRRRLRERGVRAPAGPRAARRASSLGLTERQSDVLALLAEGMSDAEIADRLVVSQRTVNHHVSAVLQALGVRSRGEAVRVARSRGVAPARE